VSDRCRPGALAILVIGSALMIVTGPATAAEPTSTETPPAANVHPDLSGQYDMTTLTPLELPKHLKNNLILTPRGRRPPCSKRSANGSSGGGHHEFHLPAQPAYASANLHVIERLRRLPDGDLLYSFAVDDPSVWIRPWSGEYRWRATKDKVYEYACHEGNYAMGTSCAARACWKPRR
jgi:hypothetical protein